MARILIADDDAHTRAIIAIWLDRHGHDSITVHNGAEALEAIEREPVDLIIADLNMPILDGLELVKALSEKEGIRIPILILTARCDFEGLAEQLSSYQVCVYPKPFFPSKLVAEINRMLGPVSA